MRRIALVALAAVAACEPRESADVYAEDAYRGHEHEVGYPARHSSGQSEAERMLEEERYMGSPLPPPAEHPASPYEEPYEAAPPANAPTPAPGGVVDDHQRP